MISIADAKEGLRVEFNDNYNWASGHIELRYEHSHESNQWLFIADEVSDTLHQAGGLFPDRRCWWLYRSFWNDKELRIIGPKIRKQTGFGLFLNKHGL